MTQLSLFWFEKLRNIIPNHLITADIDQMPDDVKAYRDQLEGRSMLVRKAQVIPLEAIVRGYITGAYLLPFFVGRVCINAFPNHDSRTSQARVGRNTRNPGPFTGSVYPRASSNPPNSQNLFSHHPRKRSKGHTTKTSTPTVLANLSDQTYTRRFRKRL